MKVRNGTVQERLNWDRILGTYQNNLGKFRGKLRRELKEARYGGREELCHEVGMQCERAAEVITHYRLKLGTLPKE